MSDKRATSRQIIGEFLMANNVPPWDAEKLLDSLDEGGFEIVPKGMQHYDPDAVTAIYDAAFPKTDLCAGCQKRFSV